MKISNKPLISIITVVYNSYKFLEGTIESISKQTHKNFEYIIVDGGSTDGTLDLIKKHDASIDKFVSEPDNGLYDAMNKALQMAEGVYVWFINSGDKIYENETIAFLSQLAEKENYPDVMYGETIIIDEADNEIGLRRLRPPQNMTWKSLINGLVVCHQSFLVKKEKAPLYNLKLKIAADYDWILKCLKNAATVVNTQLYLSRYLDNGLSKNNIKKALRERFGIMVKNYGLLNTMFNHILIGFRFFTYVFKYKRF